MTCRCRTHFDELERESGNQTLSIDSYNEMLADCEERDEVKVALSIFEHMVNNSVQATYETYELLSRMLDSKGEFRASLELAEYLRDTGGIMPDSAAYDLVLGVCSKKGERKVMSQLHSTACPGFRTVPIL